MAAARRHGLASEVMDASQMESRLRTKLSRETDRASLSWVNRIAAARHTSIAKAAEGDAEAEPLCLCEQILDM